jgi:hypothetical protein
MYEIINSIKKNNMIFISAQPDIPYFHWQVEVYLHQFSKYNIQDNCFALFGYTGNEQSLYLKELSKKYNIIAYKDERINKNYQPTIKPYLIAKFLKDYPEHGKNMFCHDSDILLINLPKFNLMLNDNINYFSDTISYIGYKYIHDCSLKYKNKYPELRENDIFIEMCNIIEIDCDIVKNNELNSGGAQYLLKDYNHIFWEECEEKCNKLYNFLCDYEIKYPIDNPIQKWTAEMWVVLWLSWKYNKITKIHNELNFSWGTDILEIYYNKPIFHLAGVTEKDKDKFFKGEFINKFLFDEYIKNNDIFNHIDKNNATYQYIKVVIDCINKNNITLLSDKYNNINTFQIISENEINNIYIKDDNKICCGKNVWRSLNNKYIIFYTNIHWIITYTQLENEIGEKCGGIAFNNLKYPFENNWNINCKINVLNNIF